MFSQIKALSHTIIFSQIKVTIIKKNKIKVQANTKFTNSFHFTIYSVKALRQGRALRVAVFIQNKIKRERERERERERNGNTVLRPPCSQGLMASAWWTAGGAMVARAPCWLAAVGGGEIREVETWEEREKKSHKK